MVTLESNFFFSSMYFFTVVAIDLILFAVNATVVLSCRDVKLIVGQIPYLNNIVPFAPFEMHVFASDNISFADNCVGSSSDLYVCSPDHTVAYLLKYFVVEANHDEPEE